MGFIILPASAIDALDELELKPGQVAIFGDNLNDGNISMRSITGQIKDLAEQGNGSDTSAIRYNSETDRIEIQKDGEWHSSDSTGGSTIKYGTNSQIPYMHPEGTEFNYIQNLRTAITPGEIAGTEVVKLHVDSWGIKPDTLTVANSSDTTKYYTKIGNSGEISGSNNNLVWTIHNNGENTTFRTNNLSPLKLGTNNTDRLIIAGDGTINIGTLGTGTASKLLAIDSSGNIVDGSSLAGSGGGDITVGADYQIPVSNTAGTGFDYSSKLTFDGNSLITSNPTWTVGQIKTTSGSSYFNIFAHGFIANNHDVAQLKLSTGNNGYYIQSETTDKSLILATEGKADDTDGRIFQLRPNGDLDLGASVTDTTYGAALGVKGKGSDDTTIGLTVKDVNDVTRFEVKDGGLIYIGTPGTGTASKLLAVDDSGNIVDGSALAGSGGGGSGFTIDAADGQIPFVNGFGDGFTYSSRFTIDADSADPTFNVISDGWNFDALRLEHGTKPNEYYTRIGNYGIIQGKHNSGSWEIEASNGWVKLESSGVPLYVRGNNTSGIRFNTDGTVGIETVGTGSPTTLLAVDSLGNIVDGSALAGSGGGGSGFTIDAVDGQIPFVDATNTAYEYTTALTFSGKTLTIVGANTNDDLIRTYTDGQVTTEVFGVKSRGDVSGAINGKGWKITRFATSSTLFGATTNNPLSLGAGTELASSNKTGGHMHINPNGNITIGDDTFNSLAAANGFDKGARLYIKSDFNGTNLHLVSNADVTLVKVSNDGTINIPSTSIKSDTPITLLAVDASGNLVDGSSLAGSGGGGSSVAYGDAGNIPFVNSTGDGFSYTNNESGTNYPGKLTFDSGTLTVRGLIPTDTSSYEAKKALTTLSVVKSHDTNNVKQSLTVRGDGTVFIGESAVNSSGVTLSGNTYQNVLAFHEMGAVAINEMENQTYVHKLYVESGGRLWFKDSAGTTSLLNAWTLEKDTGSTIERTTLTGYTKSIIDLRSGTSGAFSNAFGTSSQGMTLVAAQGAKIGTNGTSLTENTFSSSIIVSSGSANFGTHGAINNSVLVGSSATIESGSHNFVFGGSSRIYSSPSGNDGNFIAGTNNDVKGYNNIIVGSGGWLRPANLYVNNRFSNPVPDHIKYSSLIGHGLLATRDHQTLIGSGFSATYVPVPLVALTPNNTNNSNNQAHFAIYHPVDSTGNPTSDFQAHNMVFGHRAVRAETYNSLGAYPISQYSGQNIFQLVHGYNKSTLREPTGKINYTFSMWPISVTQEDTNTLVGKTGLKMKTSGTVNTGNLTNDARYHFLGESAIFNGGAHAERHVDENVSVIAIGRGNDKTTSSIKSKDKDGGTTFDVRDDGVVVYKSETFNNLPSAADSTGGQLFLTTGGSETNVMVYSNGTSWISMSTGNAIVISGGQ